MSTYIRNCYKFPSRLFVTGGREIASVEGTTHPLAMPSYVIGVIPMLSQIITDNDKNEINVKHVAYNQGQNFVDKRQNLHESTIS